MNWKFTARNMWVTFEKDEPICMLTPMRRHDLEILNPKEMEISANPELHKVYNEWLAKRELIAEMESLAGDYPPKESR